MTTDRIIELQTLGTVLGDRFRLAKESQETVSILFDRYHLLLDEFINEYKLHTLGKDPVTD